MTGGPTAKNAYRFQDWCAMYFALHEFKQGTSFEHIYCEQEKLDFEIWNASRFVGFQVKTSLNGLTAREVNNIFLFYSNKSLTSGKSDKSFRFVFGQRPIKSLDHLFTAIRSGSRGTNYAGHIKKFIETALRNIPTSSFSIDFYYFDEDQIRHMVFSASAEILKSRIGTTEDIQFEIIKDFITRLRDELDQISCRPQGNQRVYSAVEINRLIDSFLSRVRLVRLEKGGRDTIEVRPPERVISRAARTVRHLRPGPPSVQEDEEIKTTEE